jgi:hypothetical protein
MQDVLHLGRGERPVAPSSAGTADDDARTCGTRNDEPVDVNIAVTEPIDPRINRPRLAATVPGDAIITVATNTPPHAVVTPDRSSRTGGYQR